MIFRSEDIVGYPVSVESLEKTVAYLMHIISTKNRPCCYFGCLNPHSIETAAGDESFASALLDANFLTADGIGIVFASRLSGGRIKKRITGTDIFLGLTAAMNEAGGTSCFFLGSSEETLILIKKKMSIMFSNVEVVGTYSPPFKQEFSIDDTNEMIRQVNASNCDVLWIGMTAPKQEKWIHDNRHRLNVSFAGPIGAVFDFYAGNITRAGPVWQNLGLEWLPRLLQEPRRLWRRNFISSPSFLFRFIKYRFSRSG